MKSLTTMTTLVTYEREHKGYASYTLHTDACPIIVKALKGRSIDSIDLDLLVIDHLAVTLEFDKVCGRCRPSVVTANEIVAKGIAEYEARHKTEEAQRKANESARLRLVRGLAPQLRIDWPGAMISSRSPGKYRAQLAHNFAVQFEVTDTRTAITGISHQLSLTSAEDFRRAYAPLKAIEQFVAIDPQEI